MVLALIVSLHESSLLEMTVMCGHFERENGSDTHEKDMLRTCLISERPRLINSKQTVRCTLLFASLSFASKRMKQFRFFIMPRLAHSPSLSCALGLYYDYDFYSIS